MYKRQRFSRTTSRRLLLFCILLFKGVIGSQWDPLPEGVRSAVSSNHLSEVTPQVFAEYHALLPNYRGDYGVKSKLVEAATQEPTYKGANTLLLPLYIPQGAIPLAINERKTRSGKADGIAHMRILRGPLPSVSDLSREASLNRALSRRVLITGRRPHDSRSSATPPPSFLRSWLSRDPTLAKNQDNVEESKRSKQRLLSQMAHSKRRGETSPKPTRAPSSTSTVSTVDVDVPTEEENSNPKEVTRIKKIMTKIQNKDIEESNQENTTPKLVSTVIEIRKIHPKVTTEASSIASTKLEPEIIDSAVKTLEKIISSAVTKDSNHSSPSKETTTPIPSFTTTISPRTPQKSSRSRVQDIKLETTTQANIVKRRPISIPLPKPVEEIVRTVIKPVMPSVSKFKSTTTETPALKASTAPTKSSSTKFKTTKQTTSSPTTEPTTTTTQHSNVKSQQKSPSWLLRRRASIMKEINARKETQKALREDQESTKEETVSIIDRVLNSAANQHQGQRNVEDPDLPRVSVTTNSSKGVSVTTDSSKVVLVTTDSSKDSEKGVTKATSRQAEVSETTSQTPTSTIAPTVSSTSRLRIPIRTRRPIISNPMRTTSTPQTVLPSKNSPTHYLRTNYENNKNKPLYTTNTIVTSTPKFPVTSIVLNINNSSEDKRTENNSVQPKSHSRPISRTVSNYSVPKMKSPQDIVLEKLSNLMKNATAGTKENLTDIAREIEKLNEELASMGIHIIDAEFDGHKIKLRDQIPVNGTGNKFSGATTIRYIIPNTKNRKSSQKNPTVQVKDERPKISTTKTTERTYFTLTHSESPPRAVKNQPSATDLVYNKSKTNSSRFFNTSKYPGLVTRSPVTFKAIVDKERARTYEISASTPVPSSEATRTRSTIVLINAQELPEDTTWLSDNIDTVYPKRIFPTAHLRPTSTIVETTTKDTTLEVPPGLVSADFLPKDAKDEDNLIQYNNNKILNILNATMLPSEYEGIDGLNKEVEDTGSYIYFIAILGVIPCAAALVYLYKQRSKRQRKALPEREERADGYTPPINHPRQSTNHNNTLDAFPGYIFKENERESEWELSRSKLRITSVIGEGNFGIVWKAEARNLCDWEDDGGPTVLVAVKGVKEGAGVKEKTDLLRELAIMQVLGQHNNIVTLIGCCTKQEPYYLVMEYVMFGKLLEFLREQRSKSNYYNFSSDTDHLTSRDLTKFACQIATGCEYLQSRGIIHRDLAARNILVDHNKICKIADFGLARSIKDTDNDIYEQKSKGPLPIRWMAPESMYMNIYTHKSDVWSFGILCWEIVTLGSTPYPGISAREVMRRVREGYRLERPEHCRTEFYKIVTRCWAQDISSRVCFTTIREELRDLLENSSGWIDLENFQEATYYSMHQNNEEKL